MATSLETAAALNTGDFVRAFKLDRLPIINRLSAPLMRYPARQISRTVLHYDQLVGTHGLAKSSEWLLKQFTADVRIHNADAIPKDQPLLIVSNHPGLVDAMAIFSSLNRNDLRIIAAERPILRLLSHISQHIIFVPEGQGLGVVRKSARHLQQGGAILTFPAGKIEPDPKIRRGEALTSLESWSDSIQMFTRLVPNLAVLPVAVSGVISQDALNSPIARIYRTQEDQEWAAATLQVMLPRYRQVRVDVRFGNPLYNGEDVRDHMRELIKSCGDLPIQKPFTNTSSHS